MKPKSSAVKGRLAPLVLIISSGLMAQPAGDLAAHRTDDEVKDSVKAALPYLEAKVASTIMDGASTPVAFNGQLQVRSRYHTYSGLADSSYFKLIPAGLSIGEGNPLLKIGMVVAPGRNTVMWAAAGFSASFHGVNQNAFLHPEPAAEGYSQVVQHNSANVKNGVFEDLNAGIAIRTKPASFMLKGGAVNWEEASPLSVWRSQPRMFAWEYLPYEIEGPISEYYANNIAKGEMVGRSAWNKRPFQGLEFAITDLPAGINGYVIYGSGMPYDLFDRISNDMAVDLGYAGDAGPIVETGIGDSYRTQLFYRLSKNITANHVIGFNNGYVYTSSDIVNAGFNYDYVFNSKFDIGKYGSTWNVNNTTYDLTNKASYDSLVAYSTKNPTETINAESVGRGFWVDPKVFTIDGRGKIGKKLSYFADLGVSFTDTTYVTISNKSYSSKPLTLTNGTFSSILNSDNVVAPGAIEKTWNSDMLKYTGIGLYGELGYTSKWQYGLDMMYAGKNFYSPNSCVLPYDVFFPRGANLLGAGKFLGAEASPYTQNMAGFGISLKPTLPVYGHLKMKYGMNRQLSAGRDIVFMNYRLSGSTQWETMDHFFSKYSLGTIDQTYDYDHYQGVKDKVGNAIARHPIRRVGDESYGTYKSERTIMSPTSGGLRADDGSIFEGFVPYKKDQIQNLIFNHFAKSSSVSLDRDLSAVWNDSTLTFVDRRSAIDSVRVVDGSDTTYYSMIDGTDQLVTYDVKGNVINTSAVTTKSDNGFVPKTTKNSFDVSLDWSLDISKYVGYDKDMLLSLYYELNGVTSNLAPIAISASNDNVMVVSHYLRSEPAIALTKKFYLLGLIGWEKWLGGNSWIQSKYGASTNQKVAFTKSKLETTDLALGLGFDWDCLKRTSLHGRYKWTNHDDAAIEDYRYKNHFVTLELKSYF